MRRLLEASSSCCFGPWELQLQLDAVNGSRGDMAIGKPARVRTGLCKGTCDHGRRRRETAIIITKKTSHQAAGVGCSAALLQGAVKKRPEVREKNIFRSLLTMRSPTPVPRVQVSSRLRSHHAPTTMPTTPHTPTKS